MRVYRSLYERLVANTVLAVEDNPQSCWLWTGHRQYNGYGRLCVRNQHGQPRHISAHRAMMEEVLDCTFPFDEVGHRCHNPACINPGHLEVQTRWHNMAEQRTHLGGVAYINTERSWIPVLFPRNDDLDQWLDDIAPFGTVQTPALLEAA